MQKLFFHISDKFILNESYSFDQMDHGNRNNSFNIYLTSKLSCRVTGVPLCCFMKSGSSAHIRFSWLKNIEEDTVTLFAIVNETVLEKPSKNTISYKHRKMERTSNFRSNYTANNHLS